MLNDILGTTGMPTPTTDKLL